MPDPTILARGLSRLLRKLLSINPDLNFRLQLARSSLMIDSVPTHTSVSQYAEHVMAELEQVNLQSRKRDGSHQEAPKIKKFEEQRDKKDWKEKKEDDEKEKEKEKSRCRFYLTDQGCRRGKGCSYAPDTKDDKKRCWNCGGVDHMSPACTRPKDTKEGGTKPRISKVEKEKTTSKKEEETEEQQPSIKDLLKEANDMLKNMNAPSPTSSIIYVDHTKRR